MNLLSRLTRWFSLGTKLRIHKKIKHPNKFWDANNCNRCQYWYDLTTRLKIHMILMTETSPWLLWKWNKWQRWKCIQLPRLSLYNAEQRLSSWPQKINAHYNICVTGKCFQKPQTFPNQTKLEKHKTCHENPKCGQCGKVFGARRNLRRHENNVHANNHANLSTNSNKSDGDNNGNTPA